MDVQLPDGRILRGVPDGTTKSQLAEKLKSNGIDVPPEWMAGTEPERVPDPAPDLGAYNMPLLNDIRGGLGQVADFAEKEMTPAKAAGGAGETALTMGSSMLATPVSGLAGLAMNPLSPVKWMTELAGKRLGFEAPSAAEAVEGVQQAMTYQPRLPAGQVMTKAVAWPLEQLEKGTDRAGEAVSQTTGSPLLGTTAKTGLNALPMILGARGKVRARAPEMERVAPAAEIERIAGQTPQERAQNFVSSRTSLAWDRLSEDFRKRLEEVAATGSNLERLDATSIERQGLLASLDVPIKNPTRGQVTRDPLQQRSEQLLKATDAGAELKVRDLEHNRVLAENLDVLRNRQNGKAAGDIETGRSIQNALRGRKAIEDMRVRKLYDDAEKAGEAQGPINIDKLVEYLKNHEDPTQVAYAMNKLRALGAIKEEATGGITVSSNTPLTFKQLEGIRKGAVNAGKSTDGTTRHYAGELREIIDDVAENAGGEAGAKYKAARAARRAVGDEFERQGAVAQLIESRGMSFDRATALEDTWSKTVMSGSLEDLKTVRAALEKSEKGRQAWNDLKAATVDYIKNRATGGQRGLKNESGDLNAGWAGLRRALDEIGTEKLNEIFGAEDAKKLDVLVEAAQILKTEAPMGVKGSPTIDKALTLLDKLGKVPGLGGLGKVSSLAQDAKKIGQTKRDLKRATTTPLDEAP